MAPVPQSDVDSWLSVATTRLAAEDRPLLLTPGHERSLAHRLAVYLEPLANNLRVDCEYNKLGSLPKYLNPSGRTRKAKRLVRPDVILHVRDNQSSNVLALELKQDPTPKQRRADEIKLAAYRASLRISMRPSWRFARPPARFLITSLPDFTPANQRMDQSGRGRRVVYV